MVITKPFMLFFLVLLAPLFFVGFRAYIRGKRDFFALTGEWQGRKAGAVYSLKYVLVTCCSLVFFVFAVLALAEIQAGERYVTEEREGRAIVVCLDISNSMLVEDVAPSRLARCVRAIDKLVGSVGDADIGLVIFKGRAIKVLPLSDDFESVRLFLSSVEPGFVTSPGSDLERAIDTALSASGQSTAHRTIVLFTDGESLTGNPVAAVVRAARLKVPVVPVAVGTEKGGFVPDPSGGFKKNETGASVVSKTDRPLLARIADESGVRMYEADNIRALIDDLGAILEGRAVVNNRIPEEEKNNVAGSSAETAGKTSGLLSGDLTGDVAPAKGIRVVKNDLYQIFLSISIAFLAAAFIIRGSRWKDFV